MTSIDSFYRELVDSRDKAIDGSERLSRVLSSVPQKVLGGKKVEEMGVSEKLTIAVGLIQLLEGLGVKSE